MMSLIAESTFNDVSVQVFKSIYKNFYDFSCLQKCFEHFFRYEEADGNCT